MQVKMNKCLPMFRRSCKTLTLVCVKLNIKQAEIDFASPNTTNYYRLKDYVLK